MTEVVIDSLSAGEKVKLTLTPTFQIYYNEGFGIYQCFTEDNQPIVIKGTFPIPLNLEQVYDVEGEVVLHGFEKQIQVETYRSREPKGSYKVIAYLTQLKGLDSRAEKIYELFGDDSIRILKEEPERVAEAIKGVSVRMARRWQEELLERESEEQDMLFLLSLGLSVRQAHQLRKNYGYHIQRRLKDDPYILLDVRGSSIGFAKCDQMAKRMGIDFRHPSRIKHGVRYVLQEAAREGHTFLPKEELFDRAGELLDVRLTFTEMKKALEENQEMIRVHSRQFKIDLDDLRWRIEKIDSLKRQSAKERYRYPLFELDVLTFEDALEDLELDGTVVVRHKNSVALRYFDNEERLIAENIKRLSHTEEWPVQVDLERTLDAYLKKHHIELEKKQREAVLKFTAKKGGFYVLNGSAGCGKTFTLKIILDIMRLVFKVNKEPFKVKITAPTGKASKVATKATGYKAETIHRALEYHPQVGFQRNQLNPLDCTVLVVDESSMMDVELAAALFTAVRTGTTVILVGDTKQLPSVGAGNVLRDLVSSDLVEVVTLDVIKRQDKLSGIIKNANLIINGKMMKTWKDTRDAYIIHEESDESIQKKLIASIKRLLELGYTLDDVQVLVPQKRGSIGVYELNRLIQSIFNQNADSKLKNHHSTKVDLYFREGDKVIHIRNNYDKMWYQKDENGDYIPLNKFGVTNGETGVIDKIDTMTIAEDGQIKTKRRIVVKYEFGYIFYLQGSEIRELDHAYALSIHKSQGSQWPSIIIPISRQHTFFLDRNLIYTAWTRAERFGAVIGSTRVLALAIRQVKSTKRWTQLQEYLRIVAEEN